MGNSGLRSTVVQDRVVARCGFVCVPADDATCIDSSVGESNSEGGGVPGSLLLLLLRSYECEIVQPGVVDRQQVLLLCCVRIPEDECLRSPFH